jgi:hypothetical protein
MVKSKPPNCLAPTVENIRTTSPGFNDAVLAVFTTGGVPFVIPVRANEGPGKLTLVSIR